jgi:hypothetical protein
MNSLPAGAIPTTPTRFYVDHSASSLKVIRVGVHYPEDETIFGSPDHERYDYYFSTPDTVTHNFTLKEDGFYFNDYLWNQLNASGGKKKFKLRFNTTTITYDKYQMEGFQKFLNLNHHLVQKVNLFIPPPDERRLNLIGRELKNKTLQTNIEKSKVYTVNTNKYVNENFAVVEVLMQQRDLQEDSCRLIVGDVDEYVGFSKSQKFTLSPWRQHKGLIRCQDTEYEFIVPRFQIRNSQMGINALKDFVYFRDKESVQFDFSATTGTDVFYQNRQLKSMRLIEGMEDLEDAFTFLIQGPDGFKYPITMKVGIPELLKTKPSIEKNLTEYFTMYEPKYIKESRDSRLFFRFKGKGMYRMEINGQKYTSKQTQHIGFNFQGTRDDDKNYLFIKWKNNAGKSGKLKYRFPVLYDPQYHLQMDWGIYNWNRSSTNVFQVQNRVNNITYFNASFRYFPVRKWGAHFSFGWDIDRVILTRAASSLPSAVPTRHFDIKVNLLRRFFTDQTSFFSDTFTLFTGFHYKSFDPETIVVSFDIPEDIFGPHIGGEYVIPEFAGFQHIDLATMAGFTFAINRPTNYSFIAGQEIRFNMNGLGKWFGIRPYFNHHYRYGSVWQNMRFHMGLYVEVQNADIANEPRGTVRDEFYKFQTAISYQF